MSVYCKQCKHFSYTTDIKEKHWEDHCNHTSNINIIDTYKENGIYEYIQKPYEINKNNDCINFEAK